MQNPHEVSIWLNILSMDTESAGSATFMHQKHSEYSISRKTKTVTNLTIPLSLSRAVTRTAEFLKTTFLHDQKIFGHLAHLIGLGFVTTASKS